MKIHLLFLRKCLLVSFLLTTLQLIALDRDNAIQNKEMYLVEFLEEISKEHNVYFTYDAELISEVKINYLRIAGESINATLSRVLKEVDLSFKIFEQRFIIIYKQDEAGIKSLEQMINHLEGIVTDRKNTISARKGKKVEKLSSKNLNNWMNKRLVINIAGEVLDQAGQPLIGVNVLVKGTNNGTATDFNGRFQLTDVDEHAVLVFSYIGYQSQEVPVAGKTSITVVLHEDSQTLDEVVVVGYGTQKKVNLTGAVSGVSAEVLESRPIANIGQGLQGHISNLNITQSNGALGGGASFNVRGFTSINGGEPLILVNNVPMDINLINPNDIESISVLKDAASAAIYGARAAYGVILITTKSGKTSQKPAITLTTNYSINTPVVKFETMDALERMNYMNTANIARNGVPYYQFTELYQEKILAHYNDPSQPQAFPNPQNPNVWLMSGNTNWTDILLRDQYPQQQHAISISGGNDKFNYYSSLNYLRQEGIAKQFDEKYDRYNFMTNLSYDIIDWIQVGTKISINKSNKYYPPNNSANHHPEGNSAFQWHQWANWPVYFPDGNYASSGSVPNMVQFYREAGYRNRDINDSWLTGSVTMTPIENFSVNIDFTSNLRNTEEEEYWKRLPMYFVDGTISGYFPYTNPSQVTKAYSNNKYNILNAYMDYNLNINQHNMKFLVGFNQESNTYHTFNAKRENLTVESIPYINLAFGERYVGDGAYENAIRGVFTRFTYNFADKYLFEFNGRYDGSSKFPKEDRFAFFPSASFGWRLDNEAFFGNLKNTFDMFKLRYSYGSLGNQNVPGNYPYISTFNSTTANYLIGGERPLTVLAPGLVSANLTWESVIQQNVGIDFAMFDYRLNATFDIYRRDTKNMLTRSETLPAVLAVNEPRTNAADLKTTGFDLTIGWRQQSNKVNWGLRLILSDYTAEITKFSNPAGLISDYYVGQQVGELWGFVTKGIAQTDEEAQALDMTNVIGLQRAAGDLVFEDLNGDGKITYGSSTLSDPGDRKVIGNNTPRYSYGFKADAEWKGFDLDIFFQGVAKREVWLSSGFWLAGYTSEWNAHNKLLTDWWSPDNRDAYFPRPMVTGGRDVTTVQTRYLQNAAYLRLKQLTLGYTLPQKITRNIKIDRVRFYFSGNNIWEVTGIYQHTKLSDPEMNGAQFYPINRSFSLGANINF